MLSFFKKKKAPKTTEEIKDLATEEIQPIAPSEDKQTQAPSETIETPAESLESEQKESKTPPPPAEQTEQATSAVETSQAETENDVETPAPAEEAVETAAEPKADLVAAPAQAEEAEVDFSPPATTSKQGFFTRLKNSLKKTRLSFTESVASLLMGKKTIDEDLLDDLEMILLSADIGIDATDKIIQNLTEQVSRKELKDSEALLAALQLQLRDLLTPVAKPLEISQQEGPFVILMVGVNGVGKTTTIGKLAKKFQNEGKSVMLAAGDTFRAAAVEQLQTWGERNQVPVIAQNTGADSAAVIFDAVQSAKAKKIDILIADTAGRLHTQSNLMEELKKVKRVIQKVDGTAPHEVMLVLDAGTGQNALNQAKQFDEAVQLTGLTLTKLDGTAKGGIVFALAEQLGIPVRFIGVGEAIDDLRPFDAQDFSEALFDQS